jgi:hypothetical protein
MGDGVVGCPNGLFVAKGLFELQNRESQHNYDTG